MDAPSDSNANNTGCSIINSTNTVQPLDMPVHIYRIVYMEYVRYRYIVSWQPLHFCVTKPSL